MIRDDLSDRLIHLTRGKIDEAANSFLEIMKSGKLIGGTGCILGGYRCVCFSEAPIAKLSTILANPSAHGVRYRPFGVMVSKTWLFAKGGRPVVYQPKEEFASLPEKLRYRHVTYDPANDIDFTWEREWRIQTDELILDRKESTLIVPNREWEDRLRSDFVAKDLSKSLASGLKGFPISTFPWHFIILEDLGVKVPLDE